MMGKHLALLVLVTSQLVNTELGMQNYVLLPKDFLRLNFPRSYIRSPIFQTKEMTGKRSHIWLDSAIPLHEENKFDGEKMKMVLRKIFAVENQKAGNAGTVSFKIDERKFRNLIRDIKEERNENIMNTIEIDEGNVESDLDPLFQMELKWFYRIT